MTKISELHEDWSRDPEYKDAYDGLETEFAIARELITARKNAGLSQAELAERMHTTQSTIARMENGQHLPSTRSLQKFAEAVGQKLMITFKKEAA